MKIQSKEMQALEYTFELNNRAREFGFKSDEGWELTLATDLEKVAIERKYFPTIYTKYSSESLIDIYQLVKSKLVQKDLEISNSIEPGSKVNADVHYLIAFNPKRPR